MHLIHRTTCRVCGSSALTPVIDLGDQYLQGSFVKPGKELPPTRKIPTRLVRCDPMKDEQACGLLQMEHTVPPEVLYSDYWYRSGTNNTMRQHLKGIAQEAASLVGKAAACVLDIGCNDGTLLMSYPPEFQKFGIDPSDVVLEMHDDLQIVQGIFPSEELAERLGGRKVDIVTSIAMFYDLESPTQFTQNIKSILDAEGIWIFEMSYMPMMLSMTSYDTICHEHLEYYSLSVIEYVMKQAGMRIFNVSQNSINGGSLRCYATHADNFTFKKDEWVHNVKRTRQEEFDLGLDTEKPYKNFQDRVNVHKEELTSLLRG